MLLVDHGQPAPYPSLAVRARNGRVADQSEAGSQISLSGRISRKPLHLCHRGILRGFRICLHPVSTILGYKIWEQYAVCRCESRSHCCR
jgi:hypothetical protein